MLTRVTPSVLAILAIWLATICLTVQTSRAQIDCLAKPNAVAPQGTHWYYRLDRATHRQCWYLAAEGARVLQPRPRHAASNPPRQAAPATVSQVPEQDPAETVMLDRRGGAPSASAHVAEDDAPATLATRWSGFSKSALSVAPAPASISSSYAQEQPATVAEEEMPLVWPILTPEELVQGTRSPQPPISIWQLAAAFSAALGLAALLVHAFLRLASAPKRGRARVHDHRRTQLRPRTAPSSLKATSTRSVEIETKVQRLLQKLQRRQPGSCSEQPQRMARAAIA